MREGGQGGITATQERDAPLRRREHYQVYGLTP